MKTVVALLCFASLLYPSFRTQAQDKPLSIGDSVPRFTLKDQNDSNFDIGKYYGVKMVVIYFYPHDEKFETVKWVCAFRDKMTDFKKAGAIVVGINNGSVADHKAFYDKNKLNFPLLSDPDKKVMKLFGFKGRLFSGQATFIADPTGQIVFFLQRGSDHAQKALEYVRAAHNRH